VSVFLYLSGFDVGGALIVVGLYDCEAGGMLFVVCVVNWSNQGHSITRQLAE